MEWNRGKVMREQEQILRQRKLRVAKLDFTTFLDRVYEMYKCVSYRWLNEIKIQEPLWKH